MGRHVGGGRVLEFEPFCAFERGLLLRCLARFDRIDVFFAELSALQRPLAGFCQRDSDAGPQAHFAGAPLRLVRCRIAHDLASRRVALRNPIAEDPRPRAAVCDLQIEAAAVAIEARLFFARDFERREFA